MTKWHLITYSYKINIGSLELAAILVGISTDMSTMSTMGDEYCLSVFSQSLNYLMIFIYIYEIIIEHLAFLLNLVCANKIYAHPTRVNCDLFGFDKNRMQQYSSYFPQC